MTSVKGKSALVTGAGSGINEGINLCFAKALVAKGCNVLIADLALRPEAKEFADANSSSVVFQKCDVTSWTDLTAAMAAAEKAFGAVDIVCPGAGVFEEPFSNFWIPPGSEGSVDNEAGSRYKLLDINLTHPIRLTQMAIAHFVARKKEGTIVCIASIAGQLASLVTPMYIASKWGVSGFVRSLELLEPKHGIRVAAVAPGLVRTPLFLDHPEKLRMIDEAKDDWVTPEEVADAMVELVEKDEYVGGTILEVGHGQTRVVPLLNNPGPSGSGHTISGFGDAIDDVWQMMAGGNWTG
ncbi:hypothetical protein H2200_000632 [Cladophialophora chaetospira]|uniref:15-hydroxyprostaglandin dehydrogenase [NAD(+)] n=1 Tax=Cladophialophora chaetospira TaxID=386627 RepID=A0AA38XNX1_9EURO|nr:hypothetical protein H2200_000632 [Cladophialophora chaetospira]